MELRAAELIVGGVPIAVTELRPIPLVPTSMSSCRP
jgi:hypothetical protein